MGLVLNSCDNAPAPNGLPLVTAVLSLLLALITIPGNFLVCLAVYKDPFKRLRTPFTFFVVNLALSDLIVGVVTEPISVWIHFQEGFSKVVNVAWLIHMSYFISCTASVLNLAALTADRYTAISYPLRYRTRFSTKRACTFLVLSWLLSLTLPFVYFKLGYLLYTFLFANTAIAFSFGIFVITYARLTRAVRAQVLQLESIRNSSQTEEDRARIRAVAFEKKVTQAFMVMLALFMCSYTPSCLMIYVMNLCASCSCSVIHCLRDLQFIFVLCSSALNPFVYAWRLPNFRKAFARILQWRRVRRETVPINVKRSDRLKGTGEEAVETPPASAAL